MVTAYRRMALAQGLLQPTPRGIYAMPPYPAPPPSPESADRAGDDAAADREHEPGSATRDALH